MLMLAMDSVTMVGIAILAVTLGLFGGLLIWGFVAARRADEGAARRLKYQATAAAAAYVGASIYLDVATPDPESIRFNLASVARGVPLLFAVHAFGHAMVWTFRREHRPWAFGAIVGVVAIFAHNAAIVDARLASEAAVGDEVPAAETPRPDPPES